MRMKAAHLRAALGPARVTAFALGQKLLDKTDGLSPVEALRLAVGGMADILLTGQRVLPRRALDAGATFIASPASLMALLKAASYGWRQESIEANAREISRLGQELHERLTEKARNRHPDEPHTLANRHTGTLPDDPLVHGPQQEPLEV